MNDLFRNIWVFIFAMAISGCTNPTPPGMGVVALTPALTEVVLELGKGDQLIATSTYTTDERAAKVRRIPTNGILEIVTAMHPRFVLTQGNESVMTQKFEKMQIETLVLPMTTTDDIEHAVMTVGKALNASKTANSVVSAMQDDLANNRSTYDTLSPRPKVLIVVDRLDMRMQQFYIAQKPAFLADLFEGCGMSVISGGDAPWARIDAEKLYQLNPEYIAFLERSPENAAETKREFSNRFSGLNAVKNDRLIVYDRADITIPGPNSGKRQTALCEHIHAFLGHDPHSESQTAPNE